MATALVDDVASPQGHGAHSRPADLAGSLAGVMQRPINLTFLGAGSQFCPTLCRDVLAIPSNQGGEIRLVDVDVDRLRAMERVVSRLVEQVGGGDKWNVIASVDRAEVLAGSNYVVCCIEVSGPECVALDYDIPARYGIDQCIGDTIGPGGLFKGLRTIPVFLEILRDMADMCPDALMLNYTNPMNMMCLAAGRAVPEVKVVGLCHSVQGTSHELARYAGVPFEEMRWEVAGINHMAWFTRLEHKGKDLYDSVLYEYFRNDLREGIRLAEAGLASHDELDRDESGEVLSSEGPVDLIRKDVCVRFGAFVTESSGHLSEYLPYYRKSDEGRKLLRRRYDGGSRFYATNWPSWRRAADLRRKKLVAGEVEESLERSWEYASWIIESIEKDSPYRIHGNVMNHAHPRSGGTVSGGKLISNLTLDGCVEVACLVDANGIQPTRYGDLPAQMAALCASNMSSFDLGATAAIEKSKSAAAWALMHDPLTAAILGPGEIEEMTAELFDSEQEFLADYD